jgi:hypothetical protein
MLLMEPSSDILVKPINCITLTSIAMRDTQKSDNHHSSILPSHAGVRERKKIR